MLMKLSGCISHYKTCGADSIDCVIVISCLHVWASFQWKLDSSRFQKLCFRNLLIVIPQRRTLCHNSKSPFVMKLLCMPAFIASPLVMYLWYWAMNIVTLISQMKPWKWPPCLTLGITSWSLSLSDGSRYHYYCLVSIIILNTWIYWNAPTINFIALLCMVWL